MHCAKISVTLRLVGYSELHAFPEFMLVQLISGHYELHSPFLERLFKMNLRLLDVYFFTQMN